MDVIERVIKCCEDMGGEIDLSGVMLESASSMLLDVTQMELDQHVAMQPAAMAYFGSLAKSASRRLETQKRQFERWRKKKLAESRIAVQESISPNKILAADIEARFIVDNESEIDKFEKTILKLQEQYDTLYVWLEAWKQKSFSIQQYVTLTEDERNVSSSSILDKRRKRCEDDGVLSKVRGIIDRQ